MMKTIWTILGTLMAASLIAQDNTNNLPAIPPPVSSPAAEAAPASSPAPAMSTPAATTPAATPVKHKKKHVATKKKAATPEPTITLTPGPAQVNVSELIVRGQAGLKGEMVAHLYKGDTVNVLEQINLAHRSADEPGQWAKISYPTNAHIWVDAKYVDSNSTVSSKKLNLRAGPGENFSVVGVLEKGTQVTQIETKGNWMKIEPPANAYAFVAAKFLTQIAGQTPPSVATTEAPETTPQPTQVPQQPQIITTPPPAPAPPVSTVRIVQHEGVVGSVGSLVAPTEFKLYDPGTKQDIDFLYPTAPDMDSQLHSLVDARVIVTGEEGIDPRWPNTPVIAVQNIQVLEKNVIKRFSQSELTPPRLRH